MYKVLDKNTIEMEIVPNIPFPKQGFPPTVPLSEIVNAILYKMKTGVQWEFLSVRALFTGKALCWQSVYYHYRKWCLDGTFQDCWTATLRRHKDELDLSSVDLDGSHTPAIRGGEAVDYQGRKKRKTTNALYLAERQGLSLAMSEPVSGNHNDLFEVVTATLERADIKVKGLFLNADAGFDSKDFRAACSKKEINANICFNKRNGSGDRDEYFDRDLYDQRYAVERTNAWMDSFRPLLNRFDTTLVSWKGFNYLSFIVLTLNKIKTKKFK